MLAAVFGVIIYRLGITFLLLRTDNVLVNQVASIFASITAAAINLIVIMLLGTVCLEDKLLTYFICGLACLFVMSKMI